MINIYKLHRMKIIYTYIYVTGKSRDRENLRNACAERKMPTVSPLGKISYFSFCPDKPSCDLCLGKAEATIHLTMFIHFTMHY